MTRIHAMKGILVGLTCGRTAVLHYRVAT